MDRPPSQRWRVYGARGISKDHRSERAAYEHVRTIVNTGVTARVYHWEDGSWRLFDRHEPEAAKELTEFLAEEHDLTDDSGSAQISRIVEELDLPY